MKSEPCPSCGKPANVFEGERWDELYCESCGHERKVELTSPRPPKTFPRLKSTKK